MAMTFLRKPVLSTICRRYKAPLLYDLRGLSDVGKTFP